MWLFTLDAPDLEGDMRQILVSAVSVIWLLGCSSGEGRSVELIGEATAEPAPVAPTLEGDLAPSPPPSAVAQPLIATRGGQSLQMKQVRWEQLDGWSEADHRGATKSFLASCAEILTKPKNARMGVPAYAGTIADWQPACRAAAKLGDAPSSAKIAAFLQRQFRPYLAEASGDPLAKFTGYYVQSARGSLRRHGKYQTPLLKRPPDLVEVQLSDFVRDGRGRRIWGRRNATTGALERYPTRPELRRAGIKDSQVLVWLDDPVDAVFAEIQGSAVVKMDDGTTRWAAFDGKNGRRFRGVGGILRRKNLVARGQGTMAGTRKWFEAHPKRYNEIVDQNPAKVFFKFSSRAGAIGTQDVVLTARRSVAIDRAVIAFGTPVWVSTRAPVGAGGKSARWRQLLIAQDTGGAIVGPVRADIYWGEDAKAGAIAGSMSGRGQMWLLLPKRLKVPKIVRTDEPQRSKRKRKRRSR